MKLVRMFVDGCDRNYTLFEKFRALESLPSFRCCVAVVSFILFVCEEDARPLFFILDTYRHQDLEETDIFSREFDQGSFGNLV